MKGGSMGWLSVNLFQGKLYLDRQTESDRYEI